jgi:hypothetical protein
MIVIDVFTTHSLYRCLTSRVSEKKEEDPPSSDETEGFSSIEFRCSARNIENPKSNMEFKL